MRGSASMTAQDVVERVLNPDVDKPHVAILMEATKYANLYVARNYDVYPEPETDAKSEFKILILNAEETKKEGFVFTNVNAEFFPGDPASFTHGYCVLSYSIQRTDSRHAAALNVKLKDSGFHLKQKDTLETLVQAQDPLDDVSPESVNAKGFQCKKEVKRLVNYMQPLCHQRDVFHVVGGDVNEEPHRIGDVISHVDLSMKDWIDGPNITEGTMSRAGPTGKVNDQTFAMPFCMKDNKRTFFFGNDTCVVKKISSSVLPLDLPYAVAADHKPVQYTMSLETVEVQKRRKRKSKKKMPTIGE